MCASSRSTAVPRAVNAVVSLEIVSGDRVAKGDATEPTADGNYSAAFSRAFSKAYAHAIEGLKAEK